MNKEVICTVCPRGCRINVTGTGSSALSISGEGCTRGRHYAEAEYLNPVRILTSTVRRSDTDTDVLPVRTAGPIPKGLLSEGIKKIKTVTVTPPVAIHEVIIADFMGTGVDLISEKTI
ncbi:MAG: DUF1667 domain-containing protein [Anaerolineaceae bacterium]|nr:DUF1667 domain-containing protein [Anaerolineaceae bacterium]